MSALENNTVTPNNSSTGIQREQVLQQLTGVRARLGKNGLGAVFLSVAKSDPVGDTGFAGSLFLHAMLCGPIEALIGESSVPELDNTLALGATEGISALDDTQEEEHHDRRPRSSFYPLGRNKRTIKEAKAGEASVVAAPNGHFSYEVQAELAFMFELKDTLGKLEAQRAGEAGDKRLHLVTRKPSSTAYQGVERRRRPRPDGLFNA